MVTTPVDAHVHVWSDDTARFPLAPGFTAADLWLPRFTPFEYDISTAALDSAQRGRGVPPRMRINLVQMTWYGLDHSYILHLIRSDPSRFSGTGVVPAVCDVSLPDPGAAMRALAAQGIAAFRVRGGISGGGVAPPNGRWLDTPGHESMFEAAATEQLALSFLGGPGDLPELDRMMTKHPNAPVILDHFMGCARADVVGPGDVDLFCDLGRRHANCFAKLGPLDHFAAESQPPYLSMLPLLRRVIEAFGPGRCMWESDSGGPGCPLVEQNGLGYDMSGEYGGSLSLITEGCADFLSEEGVGMILGRTAEGIFFPAERAARLKHATALVPRL